MIVHVHVEVLQKSSSTKSRTEIEKYILNKWLPKNMPSAKNLLNINRKEIKVTDEFDDFILIENVESLMFYCPKSESTISDDAEMQDSEIMFQIYVYQLYEIGPEEEFLEGEEVEVSAANNWILPSKDLQGLWDSLIYDSSVKDELLYYSMSALLFSDKKVGEDIISLNRVILLHGPPGTGKTSLCKALAQKLTIRLSSRFTNGQLVEINSHSLFSKWFSESGKLVMKMFSWIRVLADDPRSIIFVLIDEVESLANARSSAQSGTEPSDSLRAVNALLTQIDALKRFPNVLILTTSNLTTAIDLAFVDRADMKKYIGLPTAHALYKIYRSCLKELMRVEIVYPATKILSLKQATEMTSIVSVYPESYLLMQLAIKSKGMSGRIARKIPFLAHANFIRCPQTSLHEYINAMSQAVDLEMEDRRQVGNAASTSAGESSEMR